MSARILFVAALHHPAELATARAQVSPGEPVPLFPPTVSQHFWERALRRRGYTLDIFYRNLPAWGGPVRAQQHRRTLTPGKLAGAALRRLPPTINPDYRARNAYLIAQAEQFQPDIIWLVGDNTVIYPATLARIKAITGATLIYASGTSPVVFSHAIERAAAPLYDLALVNDYYHGIQWLELGAARMACLPLSACDPSFHHPRELDDAAHAHYAAALSFVGTLIPDRLYSRRAAALLALAEFAPAVWSVHDVPAALEPYLRGPALGETMLRALSASRLTLNAHGNFMLYGGNMRLFEAAGVGVAQMTEDLPGVRTWFTPGEEIITYRDLDDLKRQTRHYLSHDAERDRIAARARERAYAEHTYEQRIDAFEALL
jgi:hypothetical protein